jgi:SAM-dependent methyltransferase
MTGTGGFAHVPATQNLAPVLGSDRSVQFGPIASCQVCGDPHLEDVLFLGFLPPVNTMRPIGTRPTAEEWFPAQLLRCPSCSLAQLGYAADPNVLFPPDYPYTSGSTRILRENFQDLYREVNAKGLLQPGDLVVDIGSNDGTLLSNFHNPGYRVVGIEPTEAGDIARERGITTVRSFFDSQAVDEVVNAHGRAKVVTATNVFAHIHGVNELMDHVRRLLAPNGVFITESHYLGDLVETLQYDTIYHEHLRYYSLTSLSALLERHGFAVWAVTRIPTHGGSIRVFAGPASQSGPAPARIGTDSSVEELLAAERASGLAGYEWIAPFRQRVAESRLALLQLVSGLLRGGARISGIGAPSRATTLATYTGLSQGILDSVYEIRGSRKIGKYMPGTLVPVLDEEGLYQEQPSHALLLSWHIQDELCRALKKRGFRGDFITPLPEPRVILNRDVQAG